MIETPYASSKSASELFGNDVQDSLRVKVHGFFLN